MQNVQNILFHTMKAVTFVQLFIFGLTIALLMLTLIVVQNSFNSVMIFFFKAFQKMDTKKKEEQLKILKEKYGINTDPPK